MSDIILGQPVSVDESVKVDESIKVEEQLINDEKSACIFEPSDNLVVELTKQTIKQLFEKLLHQNKEELDKINIKLNPDMQKYFLFLCKEQPEFFADVEESLNKIILDNNINSKDIPEIIILVTKIYEIIKNRQNLSNVDPYDVIKTLLQILFKIYIEEKNISNPELEGLVIQIIDVSINLIKLKGFKPSKKGCLSKIFKL